MTDVDDSRWREALNVLRQGSVLLGAVLLAVIWAAVALTLRSERVHDLRHAERTLQTMARAYADDAARSLKEVDKTLLLLRRAYEANPTSFDLPSFTRSAYFVSDVTLQIALIGPDGMLASTNLGPQPTPVYLSDREHFRVHRESSEDRLFISAPVLGRASGKWSVQLTRRLTGADGSFAGVLVASVDPAYLARFFSAVEDGPDTGRALTLVGEDGVVRARGSRDGPELLGHSILGTPLMARIETEPQGLATAAGPFGAEVEVAAYRRLADFPLTAIVSQPLATATRAAGRDRPLLVGGASLLSLLVLLGLLASVVHELRLARARRALAGSEARPSRKSRELAVALENMSQGIMMIDAEQNVAVINRRCVELLGLPERFLETRPAFSEVLAWQWDTGEFGTDGAALDPAVHAFIQSGGVSDTLTVYERRRPNGTVLEVRSLPLPGGGIVRTYTDVTERTEAAAQLAEARDRAETASRARTAFLAMMSHEIRTPLNGVIGMASLLAGTSLDEEQLRYTGTLRDSAEQLLQIIDDVLDFSKLEADRGPREEVSFDLERTIESVLGIVAPRARDKGLFLGAIVDPAIPDLVVGDSGAVRQVLLNLVGNGVKFTAEGSVVVEASAVAHEEGDEHAVVRFSVRDTGIGIAPTDVPSLFREFSQLDDSIARRFGGTGLGLAISKHLVERHGGTIMVDSAPGRGSTFSFTLPFRRADGASRATVPVPLQGQRWIVVAAREDMRRVDTALLAAAGAETAPAKDRTELAAHLAAASGPDGILLDASAGDLALGGIVEELRASRGSPRLIAVAPLGVPLAGAELPGLATVLKGPLTRRALVEAAMAPGPGQTTLAPGRASGSTPVAPAAPARSVGLSVLVADDNITNRMVLEALIASLGHRVTAVADGQAAVARVASESFDAVLMDLMMPGLDGFAATRRIRALPGSAGNTPVVAISASARAMDGDAVRAAGMDAFAAKPVSRDRLRAALEAAVAVRRGHLSAGEPPDPSGAPTEDRAPAATVIDHGAWDAICAALDPDTVGEILGAFLEDTESRIARMSHPDAAPATIAGEAHALKSAAGTFGFRRLQSFAEIIERSARDPEHQDLATTLAGLRPLFEEVRAAVPSRTPASTRPTPPVPATALVA